VREKLQPPGLARLVARCDSWVLLILTRPPASRLRCGVIVAALVVIVGLIDYATGTAVSLQVFYLAPILLALAWLGLFAACLAAVSSIIARVGGDYLLGAEYTRRPAIVWNSLGFLAIYMVVAWFLEALLKLRRELEERVTARTAALAREVRAREQLQRELFEISERERRTIGHDLYDGLSQHLTAMAFAAQVLGQQLANRDELAVTTAREIGRLAEEGILQSRELARDLLLTAIEPGSLNRELEELAATVQRQTGVRCHYEARRTPLVSDSSTASHLFRIAQQAVRHALRHAQPTALQLCLAAETQGLVLTISDNGATPPPDGVAAARSGLLEVEHRAKLIGAEFRLEASPGQGTRISCCLPPAAAVRAPAA
jgi:signal transduction histidine kinase